MNHKIIEQFNLLIKQVQAEYLNAQVENDTREANSHFFRLKQIKQALNVIKNLDFEITEGADLKGIPGIGKGTMNRIDEILETGTLSELETKYAKNKQKVIDEIQELEKIIGVGSKTAKKLVTEKGIKSVAQLKKMHAAGKIELNDKILLGLKYYGKVEGNIPRSETTEIKTYLTKKLKLLDSELKLEICGSYRRGKDTSGDIDVIIYHPEFKTTKFIRNPEAHGMEPYLDLFVDLLSKEHFLLDHMVDREHKLKYMGFCRYKDYPIRRIDIRWMPYNSIHTAFLYNTGPFELNTVMRKNAKKMGMRLNEYGLYKVNDDGTLVIVKINSEKDVFDKLKMPYLTPTQREGFSLGKTKKTI